MSLTVLEKTAACLMLSREGETYVSPTDLEGTIKGKRVKGKLCFSSTCELEGQTIFFLTIITSAGVQKS